MFISAKRHFPSLAVVMAAACFPSNFSIWAQQPAAAPNVSLQPYTAPDKSVSAGVPAGWKVTLGKGTVIQMAGPQGETLNLGAMAIAKNAPFQAGQKIGGGIDMAMPYSASLDQKLNMILQNGAAATGHPPPNLSITSSTPIALPPAMGQCGRFVGDMTGAQGPVKVLALICSMPVDPNGVYKNMMMMAQAPPAVATQTGTVAQAVFRSYSVPAAQMQNKLAPFSESAQQMTADNAKAAAINRQTIKGMIGSQQSANCMDLVVIRELPKYQLPRSCGGLLPD